MYIPERKLKENLELLPEYEKITDKDFEDIEALMGENEKIEIFKNIEREFKDPLGKISITQLNRFYSMVESRKFYSDSKTIKKFIDEQLDRIKNGGNDNLKSALSFYEKFVEQVLSKNLSSRELQKYMELLKRFARYMIGEKRIIEKSKEGDN